MSWRSPPVRIRRMGGRWTGPTLAHPPLFLRVRAVLVLRVRAVLVRARDGAVRGQDFKVRKITYHIEKEIKMPQQDHRVRRK